MPEWMRLFINDTSDIVTGMSLSDMAMPSFVAFWCLILLLPLRGIDRRDMSSALDYCLYCAAAGITLIVVLPQKYISGAMNLKEQFFIFLLFSLIAASRWVFKADGSIAEKTMKRFNIKKDK